MGTKRNTSQFRPLPTLQGESSAPLCSVSSALLESWLAYRPPALYGCSHGAMLPAQLSHPLRLTSKELRSCAESETMPNRDSETLRKQRESCRCPVVLLGSIRYSPVRFTGHGGRSALAIRSFNDLPFPLVSVVCARANCLGKAGFQAGQESSTTHIFGESPYGSGRYFDLRLAPDYAESLRCGKAQAAAMAR